MDAPRTAEETDRRRVNGARLRLLELAPHSTTQELLTATLDLAEALTGSNIGFLHFVEEDQSTLWLQAWSTNTMERMCSAEGAGSHYAIEKAGVWADCVRTGAAVIHNDYDAIPDRKGMPAGHARVVRELTVPVVRSGRICAVLGVGNKPTDYDDRDVEDVTALADLAWDIAARKRAEEALQESEQRFRALANGLPAGIVQADSGGGIRYANPAWQEMTGGQEGVAGDWLGAVAGGLPLPREHRLRRPDGTETWVRPFVSPLRDAEGAVTGYVGGMVDVSETHELHARLALTSRLASMGTLVSGVAHEVNNPLAAQMADQGIALEIAREVRDRLASGGPVSPQAEARRLDAVIESLEEAQESSHRIARVVKNLATFGRTDAKHARLRLGDVVTLAMRWLPSYVGRTATVQVDDGGAPEVLGTAGQPEQVVVNLVSNAARAIPPDRRGLVIVRIGPGTGGTARMDVVDDGVGIEPDLLDRIFEPFFTTRPSGPERGTGLGLPICHAIVTSHGGTLSVTSQPGRGSCFRVEMPAAPAAA